MASSQPRHGTVLSMDTVAAGLGGVSARIAGEEEIAGLNLPVLTDGFIRDRLDDWSMVTVVAGGRAHLHVVGRGASAGKPVVTSALAAIDSDKMLVRTRSGSVYGLSGKVVAVLPPAHLAALRATLVGWFSLPKEPPKNEAP